MGRYVWRELVRNRGRTLVSVLGVGLAVAFVASIALFVDASAARMTEQALRPVTVDLQVGVANPLASSLAVEQSVSPHGPFQAGQTVTVSIAVRASAPATAVVVKDAGSDRAAYVPGSTRLGGTLVADALSADDPPSVTAPLSGGVTLPTLAAGATTTITYQAKVAAQTPTDAALGLAAAATSREDPTPAPANGPPANDLAGLTASIRGVAGVRVAEPFTLVDLPAGALRLGPAALGGPLKVMALDQSSYQQAFPVIRVLAGDTRPGTATLSRAAADALGAGPGSQLQLAVPGRPSPVALSVGAVADLTRAGELFASRSADTLGDPVPAPFVLGLDPATFASAVLPALRADAAAKAPVAQPPVVEIHVGLDRRVLGTDPARALVKEQGLRRTLERTAPGQLVAIDNVAGALSRAQRDAILAKALFLLLGLPGVLLAAAVARYAAGLFAAGQRRERALLRARGFGPTSLRRGLGLATVVIGLVGAVMGLAGGAGAAAALLPLGHVARRSMILSILLATVTAAGTAVAAVYLPGRRSLVEEVATERRELAEEHPPRWLTRRADVVLIAAAAVVAGVTYLAGGYKVTAAATEGQSVALSFFFLLAPLFGWLGVTLLVGRGLLGLAGRLAHRRQGIDPARPLGRRLLWLSLLRRRQRAVSGICVIALATAFTVGLAIFVGTYRHEQRVDARFVVGGDVRVSLGSSVGVPADIEARLRPPGVVALAPVASTPSAQVGNDKNLTFAAIDPRRFAQLGVLNGGFSSDLSPAAALAALERDPAAVLVDRETAKTFNLHRGDTLRVDLPNGALGRVVSTTVRVAGTHIYFPGFPQGVDFVGNLATYQSATALGADAYALATAPGVNPRDIGAAIVAGAGHDLALRVDTTASAVNREQSTLAALNLASLNHLDQGFGLVLGASGAAVFVFGILLARRREHVTLRAMGLSLRSVAGIVLGEACVVAAIAVVIGTAIGIGLAAADVQILRPLFVIPPHGLHTGVATAALPAGLVIGGALLAVGAGLGGLVRAKLVEILRED